MVTFDDVKNAHMVLKNVVHRTPLEFSRTFSTMTDVQVYMKLENLQKTGSFKIRGAYNTIYHLSNDDKKRGVVCASAGNHAQGVAYAATLLGVKSTVFMPIYTPPVKIIATKSYGAEVVLEGATYDDAAQAALKYSEEKKMVFVHAFNNESVIAGQGTIGLEIYDDLPDVDVVLVPIGGGGLISGIAVALKKLKPNVKIIGVEAGGLGIKKPGKNCATLEIGTPGVLHGSYSYLIQSKNGQIMDTHSISAGLDYPGVGPEHSYLKDMKRVEYVSVTDKEALEGFRLLSELEGIIPALEPSHAIAYLKKLAPKLDKSQIVIVCLSGRGDKDVNEVKAIIA